jgi:hypothetical protein
MNLSFVSGLMTRDHVTGPDRSPNIHRAGAICSRPTSPTAGQKDGIIEGWLDGVKALSKSDLRFRDTQTPFSIDTVLWSNFFGGNTSAWAPTKDEWIYFDDFVLSKSPITH